MRRLDNLEDWKVFCTVASSASIQAAADILESDASIVSRTLTRLEQDIGRALIDRSKRPFRLTAAGEAALKRAEKLLDDHAAMIEEITQSPDSMSGTLRIALPPGVLRGYVVQRLAEFHRRYPELDLDIIEWRSPLPVSFQSRNGLIDIVSSFGPDPASENIVQIQYSTGLALPCASPEYLRRHGEPQSPEDLADHTGIIFHSQIRPEIDTLTMKRGGEEQKRLAWKRQMHFYSSGAATAVTTAGLGINPGIPTLHCADELASGQLVPVLPGWCSEPLRSYLYIRPESLRLRKVRVFVRWYCEVMDKVLREADRKTEAVLSKFFSGTSWVREEVEFRHWLFLEESD